MSADLLSVRAMVVSASLGDQELFRKAAKKPFFPADIEAILCNYCNYYGLSALNPDRASAAGKGGSDSQRD